MRLLSIGARGRPLSRKGRTSWTAVNPRRGVNASDWLRDARMTGRDRRRLGDSPDLDEGPLVRRAGRLVRSDVVVEFGNQRSRPSAYREGLGRRGDETRKPTRNEGGILRTRLDGRLSRNQLLTPKSCQNRGHKKLAKTAPDLGAIAEIMRGQDRLDNAERGTVTSEAAASRAARSRFCMLSLRQDRLCRLRLQIVAFRQRLLSMR